MNHAENSARGASRNPDPVAAVPGRRALFWPWLVAGLLAATAVVQAIMLYAATMDPTFSVEPDYYRRAVAWDSTMARQRASIATGWHARATIVALDSNDALLSVHVTDSAGAPVPGSAVDSARAILVNNLDGARHVEVALSGIGAGTFAVRLDRPRRGLWEIRLELVGRNGRFAPTLRTEFVP